MQVRNELSLASAFTFEECRNFPIYRWFHYKEGYSPRVVDYCIKESGLENPIVYDPFCGTGTTMLRAKELGFKSFGIDASPLAVLVSKTKAKNYSQQEITELEAVFEKICENSKSWKKEQSKIDWNFSIIEPKKAFPQATFEGIAATRIFLESLEQYQKDFFMTALLSIFPYVSYAKKDGGFLRIDKGKRCVPFLDAFRRKAKNMLSDLKLPAIKNTERKNSEAKIELADARRFVSEEKFNLAITSPPYVNAVDYSKVYGLELSLLLLSNFNLNQISGNLVSSTIFKNSGETSEFSEKYAKIPIVAKYFSDMALCIGNISKGMEKTGGHAFLIVSNGIVHDAHIPVDEELALIFENLGYESEIIVGALRNTRINGRKFNARESIVHAFK